MRKLIDGNGNDATAAYLAYIGNPRNKIYLADLYLIGELDDPQVIALTNWETPLCWPIWGKNNSDTGFPTFLRAAVTRGTVESKIGLSVSQLNVTWTPKLTAPTQSIATANWWQLAQLGFFRNRIFRHWIAFMPTPGDCMTFGAAEFFGGKIYTSPTGRGKIAFTVNSFLDVVNQMVPTNVIEMTNTSAGYAGATPPVGLPSIPQFDVKAGSTNTFILGAETAPNAGQVFAEDSLVGGFLVFNGGAGATLGRQLFRIAANKVFISGSNHWNGITVYGALPWPPTPGVDTFFISGSAPINTGQLQAANLNSGGTGYTVGDVLTMTDGHGTGATVTVITVGGGGAITSAQLTSAGQGYITTTASATSGGTGTGATFDLIIPAATQGFPYVPVPTSGG